MPEGRRAVRALALGFLAMPAAAQTWQVWESPYALARLDAADQVLERSSRCLDGCRYDRDGLGSELPSWNVWPQRSLYSDGVEDTVFDERGPGAITRLWLTTGDGTSRCLDPALRVRFYLDGAAMPALDLPLAQLFDGSTSPFQPPLALSRAQSSGGYVSYVPIAYAQGLRVTFTHFDGTPNPCQPVDANPNQHLLWYQFQFHRWPAQTMVASFPAGDFAAYAAWLSHEGDNPWADALAAPLSGVASVAPGQSVTLASRNGSGWLRGLRLQAPPAAYAGLRLRLRFDGVSAVDLPFAQFFARADDALRPPRGVLLGEDAAGWLYAWFPMPYRAQAEVALVGDASLAAATAVQYALLFDDAGVPDDAGAFFAQPFSACGRTDLTLFERAGAGRIVGFSGRHGAQGGGSADYLEADERLYVDGGIGPRWYGTGLEDFYDGGFYFDGGGSGVREFGTALAGASRVDIAGTISAWRLMPLDGPSFQSALRWRLEAGSQSSVATTACASGVVLGYGQAPPRLVAYEGFDLGTAAADAHAYASGTGAVCAEVSGRFSDEPATARTATQCRYAGGRSRFRFDPPARAAPLRLRRVFDASTASVPAQVFVNGVAAGWFPFAPVDPARRWAEQDLVLAADAYTASDPLDIEVVPAFAGSGDRFDESAYTLWGGWVDTVFADGFGP